MIQLKKILVKYNTIPDYDDLKLSKEIEDIKSGLIDIFGEKTVFNFEECGTFKRNSTGKFKWIISEL